MNVILGIAFNWRYIENCFKFKQLFIKNIHS